MTVLETREPVRTFEDAKALMAQLATDELTSPNGCPPLLIGATLSGEVHYIPMDFTGARIKFHPDVLIATARAMDERQPMRLMGMFLPIALRTGFMHEQRIGAYATLQSYGQRHEALFLLDEGAFIERRSDHIHSDMFNPFAFLAQRILA